MAGCRLLTTGVMFFPGVCLHSVVPMSCASQQYADSPLVMNGHIKRASKPIVEMRQAMAKSTPVSHDRRVGGSQCHLLRLHRWGMQMPDSGPLVPLPINTFG
jgi:hypothetical protein